MKIVIDIPEEDYSFIKNHQYMDRYYVISEASKIFCAIKHGTPLPSIEPERKPGKWVHMVGWWECDQCHAEYTGMPTCMGKVIYEYCPMCGVKMEDEG